MGRRYCGPDAVLVIHGQACNPAHTAAGFPLRVDFVELQSGKRFLSASAHEIEVALACSPAGGYPGYGCGYGAASLDGHGPGEPDPALR